MYDQYDFIYYICLRSLQIDVRNLIFNYGHILSDFYLDVCASTNDILQPFNNLLYQLMCKQ